LYHFWAIFGGGREEGAQAPDGRGEAPV